MTGRDFYANEVVNILMICLHEARVCFNIPEKLCAPVCVRETEMVHPGGEPVHQLDRVCSTGAPRCFTAGSNTKEQQEC